MPESDFFLKAIHIRKTFDGGKVVANDDISLHVKKNEIHAIVGENGAGKTTLISILFGLYRPDSGKVYLDNKELMFKSAKEAIRAGIGLVQQHFSLVGNYTVFENIILGAEITKYGILNRKKARDIIKKLIEKYNLHIRLSARVGSLSVAQQQKVELLKVLFRQSKIIIFDEPTAALSELETESFLRILKRFKAMGQTIILITHKLKEVKQVADTASVIRRGRLIQRVNVADTTIAQFGELMVGQRLVEVENEAPKDHFDTPVILSVKNLDLRKKNTLVDWFHSWEPKFIKKSIASVKKFLSRSSLDEKDDAVVKVSSDHHSKKLISFDVHAGEIFAIAGVSGNGQKEIAEVLTGMRTSEFRTVEFLSKDVSKWHIGKRRKLGLSYVPEDRHRFGLTLDDSCWMNLVENVISSDQFSLFGFIKRFQIMLHANNLITKFDIRGTVSGSAFARSLSGGNQQKIILARELYVDHELLVLVQPTRGLDVFAVQYVHQRIMEERKKNKAIVLISYELDEIFALADTITVMSNKEFLGIYPRSQITYQKIGQLMGGEKYE